MGTLKEIHDLMEQADGAAKSGIEEDSPGDVSGELESDAFNAYMNMLRRTPLLKPDEEQVLTRLAKQGSEDARQKVIQANLRLVVSIARKYRNRGLGFMDLISEGNAGLIRALNRYEPEKGFRFSTYATYWIREAVLRAISNDSRFIRLPVQLGQAMDRYQRAVAQLERQGSLHPKIEDIARIMGVSVEEAHKLSGLSTRLVSLDAQILADKAQSFAELIADGAPGTDSQVHVRETFGWIENALHELPNRQRMILGYRFGLYGNEALTLEEVADMMHLSQERVRQLEKEGLKLLRQILVSKGIALHDFY
jgi:RNA polymerase sigma factor (sigma-70 family)